VNNFSQIKDIKSGSFCNPTKLREMVTHLGTHLFIRNKVNIIYAPCCYYVSETIRDVFFRIGSNC